ncbi:Outer membrane protein [Pyrenophora tritici-repentis]|nr:Outer membrane protein [Pyrenophora tritici-repentis]
MPSSTWKIGQHTAYRSAGKVEDVYIGVMGVTGAGKSSFIDLCTGQKIGVGQGLRSHTQEIGEFAFMLSANLRVHLVDTPGFDDTDRKDTDVLRDIAGWLGVSYTNKKRLSGMIFLHRIIDPRMQGSAKRNLFMFQKLCGEECFSRIILATTMWSLVPPGIGAQREQELMRQDDFWGFMLKKGSRIMRHTDENDRSSALAILNAVVRNRKEITLRIQQEMSTEGLGLEETEAGQQLNEDITKERERHRRDIEELQQEKEEALAVANQEAAEQINELQADLAKKIQAGEESQERLRTDLEKLQAERKAELKKLFEEMQEQKDKLDKMEADNEETRFMATSQTNREEFQGVLSALEESMRIEKETLKTQFETFEKKKNGVIMECGEWLQLIWDGVCAMLE